MKYRLLTFLLPLIFVAFSFPAFAQTEKEKFIAAWEEHIKSLPTTVKLEKTDTPDVYEFETTLFPYKGPLEILNVVIDQDLDYYYDYNIDTDARLKGVAEIDLPDLSEKFFAKHTYSHDLWQRENFLFQAEGNPAWLSANKWYELQPAEDESYSASSQYKQVDRYKTIALDLAPLLIFLLIFLVLVLRSVKMQKMQFKKYDLSMERQQKAIEQQEESMRVAKDSIALQKEQVALLQKLLEKK